MNYDPIRLVAKAEGLNIDLFKVAYLAETKSAYYYSAEDNFARFNYYRAVANVADALNHRKRKAIQS